MNQIPFIRRRGVRRVLLLVKIAAAGFLLVQFANCSGRVGYVDLERAIQQTDEADNIHLNHLGVPKLVSGSVGGGLGGGLRVPVGL